MLSEYSNKTGIEKITQISQFSGLSEKDLDLIRLTIATYPDISQAKIFGSCAKGNYKVGSDIDIALFFNHKLEKSHCKNLLFSLHDKLEETLPIPYFFDLVNFNTIESDALKEHINRVGIPLL